jgi:hypothetical protein
MAYCYVYIPVSNAIGKAKQCYNNNCQNGGGPCLTQATNSCTNCGNNEACDQSLPCPHCSGINGMTRRGCADIGGPANTAVKCYVSSNIKSIYTTKTGPNDDGDLLCANTPPPNFAWVNEGVKVKLYCAPDGQGPIIGTLFYGHLKSRIANGVKNSPHGKILGYIGDLNCNCICYNFFHVHMERDSIGSTNSWAYGQSLSTSFWVYRWSGPDYCPV